MKEKLEKRGIEYVYHFTDANNLWSILNYGLKSRKEMEEKGMRFSCSDEVRLDNRLNYISLSVGFPNYKMFCKKRLTYRKKTGLS